MSERFKRVRKSFNGDARHIRTLERDGNSRRTIIDHYYVAFFMRDRRRTKNELKENVGNTATSNGKRK